MPNLQSLSGCYRPVARMADSDHSKKQDSVKQDSALPRGSIEPGLQQRMGQMTYKPEHSSARACSI